MGIDPPNTQGLFEASFVKRTILTKQHNSLQIAPVTDQKVSPPKLIRTVNIDVPIVGLPKTKAKNKMILNAEDTVGNHCFVCDIVFQSAEDVKSRIKGPGSQVQNTKIGCSVEDCEFQVHVWCSDSSHRIKTKKRQERKTIFVP